MVKLASQTFLRHAKSNVSLTRAALKHQFVTLTFEDGTCLVAFLFLVWVSPPLQLSAAGCGAVRGAFAVAAGGEVCGSARQGAEGHAQVAHGRNTPTARIRRRRHPRARVPSLCCARPMRPLPALWCAPRLSLVENPSTGCACLGFHACGAGGTRACAGSSRWDAKQDLCYHCRKAPFVNKRRLCMDCYKGVIPLTPADGPAHNLYVASGGYRVCSDHCSTIPLPLDFFKHLPSGGTTQKCLNCLEKRRGRKNKPKVRDKGKGRAVTPRAATSGAAVAVDATGKHDRAPAATTMDNDASPDAGSLSKRRRQHCNSLLSLDMALSTASKGAAAGAAAQVAQPAPRGAGCGAGVGTSFPAQRTRSSPAGGHASPVGGGHAVGTVARGEGPSTSSAHNGWEEYTKGGGARSIPLAPRAVSAMGLPLRGPSIAVKTSSSSSYSSASSSASCASSPRRSASGGTPKAGSPQLQFQAQPGTAAPDSQVLSNLQGADSQLQLDMLLPLQGTTALDCLDLQSLGSFFPGTLL